MPIARCMRNVAAGIVLISLAVYLFLFCLFACFLAARFWRNKMHIFNSNFSTATACM